MRVPAIVAGAALVLVACGGKKAETEAPAAATPPPAAMAPTPATGATHEIQMVQEGTVYKFVPAVTTIKVGDAVSFKSVSGLMHDIVFYADSIPPGSKDALNSNIPDKTAELSTAMINDGSAVSVSFAGLPAGTYKFYCLPHQAMGMKGEIIVQ